MITIMFLNDDALCRVRVFPRRKFLGLDQRSVIGNVVKAAIIEGNSVMDVDLFFDADRVWCRRGQGSEQGLC